MSSIRSAGGKADKELGSTLWRRGLRYRRHSKLVGKPDLVFNSARVVVFVDGDFWHGRGLEERLERGDFKSNAEYWIPKLTRNRARDQEVTARLAKDGWTVLRFWESEVKKDLDQIADSIEEAVRTHGA